MPEISRFFGMIILMYWDEHNPPHFHVRYGDDNAVINIKTLALMDGKLSRRALSLVLDWAELHQKELLEDWDLCQNSLMPKKIEPLK
ncbi:MAG: DUF4160 domain-containing protein [Neisseriales bacterium]|mgnify:CR=1 FL=1|jgi:hypothetical protein|nr:MAG: DUF4160 domain-containing protein [Neisseriales bacterium]